MTNEMNPGSFNFGPLWWAIFIAIAAFAVVGVMMLFLWQASKESVPRTRVHQRIDRPLGAGRQQVGRELGAAQDDPRADLLDQPQPRAEEGLVVSGSPLIARPTP
ncbi:hypothetical protein [Nocardioides sp. W7]|uniref:hypothetical protein n=1 Tax=Nocardioides sp. W7 TaxID=2931390 RepID=UPI001FD05C28|nr:hypothetical protein [Nocardioides sp. W7]